MNLMDLYGTLGIGRTADCEEIRAAFKKLAKNHHPDIAGGENETFNSIRKAYDLLMDPKKRGAYDEYGFVPGDDASAVVNAPIRRCRAFSSLLSQVSPNDFERMDVIGQMKEAVTLAIANVQAVG